MLDTLSAPGANAGTPSASEPRGLRAKSINRFAADHDMSRSWVYALIAANKLTAVRIGSRLRITAEAERAFEDAAERGLLADTGK
jgi:excisionase family DNA binding protein